MARSAFDLEQYGDSEVWFELEVSDSSGKRVVIGDYDTREAALGAELPVWARMPRVYRKRGDSSL